MSIGRNEIMHIVKASAKHSAGRKGGISDDAVMWLIVGGWALFVALLDCLNVIESLIAGGAR